MLIYLFLLIFLNQHSHFLVYGSPQISFSYPSFNPSSCDNGTLICMGSVSGGDGYLKLTQEPPDGNSANSSLNQIGRVLHYLPATAWPAIITTTFTVRISKVPNSINYGDGMTFIMAQDKRPSPPSSYGSHLGNMDKSTQDGVVRQIAVELDTNPNEFDMDGNHIGIDTTKITAPVAAKTLNGTDIDLKSGKAIHVQISYGSWSKRLQVSVAYKGNPLVSFLDHSIDMAATVPAAVYVGFTASTGRFAENHQVLDWTFQSVPLADVPMETRKEKMRIIILISVVGLLVGGILMFPLMKRILRKKKELMKKQCYIDNKSKSCANVPKVFTYKQLSKATRRFSEENLLGSGGIGSV